MSDTLLLTKGERREESEGGSFLIEFPDNMEINLTPVKFDYSSGSLLSCSPHCEMYVFPPMLSSLPFLSP